MVAAGLVDGSETTGLVNIRHVRNYMEGPGRNQASVFKSL